MRGHVTPVSRLISLSLDMLHHSSPGLRLVVSYADPGHGHHGAIYQAANWVYLGTTPTAFVYVDGNGRRYHPREVSATGFKKYFGEIRATPRCDTLRREVTPGKHRYVYPFDRSMRRRVQALAKPYPRAEQVSMGDA